MKTYTPLDTAGVTLSALCVIHCLFLPVIGTSLPIIGLWAEVEWVHKVLVLMAFPVAISLITTTSQPTIRLSAISGLALLFGAAFLEPLHEMEVGLTVIGAFLLSLAHMLRLANTSHSH